MVGTIRTDKGNLFPVLVSRCISPVCSCLIVGVRNSNEARQMSSFLHECNCKLLASFYEVNDLWEPSSNKMFTSTWTLLLLTVATAVFNKRTLSPAKWNGKSWGVEDIVVRVVKFWGSWVFLSLLFASVQRLVWCFCLQWRQRNFELHFEILWYVC